MSADQPPTAGAALVQFDDGLIVLYAPAGTPLIRLPTGTVPRAPDAWCRRDHAYRSYLRLRDEGIAGATFGISDEGRLVWIPPEDAGCIDWPSLDPRLNVGKDVIMVFRLLDPPAGALLWVLDGDGLWRGRLYEVGADGLARYVTRPYWDANQDYFRAAWQNVIPVNWSQMEYFAERGMVAGDLDLE